MELGDKAKMKEEGRGESLETGGGPGGCLALGGEEGEQAPWRRVFPAWGGTAGAGGAEPPLAQALCCLSKTFLAESEEGV